MRVLVFLLFSILILQITSAGIFCDNSASQIGGGVLDFNPDVLEFELLDEHHMDGKAFSTANSCASKKICTYSCSCGKAYYFDVGTKKITYPPGVKLINTLENEDETLSDTEEISPDDATTEDFHFNFPKIDFKKLQFPTIRLPKIEDAFPLLSAKYDDFCIKSRSQAVQSKIQSIIDDAVRRHPIFMGTQYSHTPFAFNSHLSHISPDILKKTTIVNLHGKKNILGLGTMFHGISQSIGLFMTSQQRQVLSLGKILQDFAETVNRLCEDDELVSSTPLEYLMQLWDNYVQQSAPNVPKTEYIQNLVTLILKEIMAIWVKRCECSDLIQNADPNGNYQNQKQVAEDACLKYCAPPPKITPRKIEAHRYSTRSNGGYGHSHKR